MEKNSKIYVAGHTGLVGSALLRELKTQDYNNFVFKTSSELDLRNQWATENFFFSHKPEYVFLSAAKVGGIKPNSERPAEFIYDNLQIQNNVINSSYKFDVRKLVFFGSNCIYPKDCKQPMKEEYLLTGKIEETNEAYAIAKIAGLKMCQSYNKQYGVNFITLIPASLFGPNDNFNLDSSHFTAALIRRFFEAKIKRLDDVIVWGTGNPRREIMHVSDLVRASIFLMNNYSSSEPINVGIKEDFTIREISDLVKRTIGFEGRIAFDSSKPDGVIQKLLDSSKIYSLGWKPRISLDEGLTNTIEWYALNHNLL